MKEIVLFGNSNTGKTTLFNTLTSSNEHSGNWHGVTVAVKTKKTKFKGEEVLVHDLPGLNSLNVVSFEEKIAFEELKKFAKNKDATIFNICDFGNLSKNLYLTMQLKELGIPFVLVLNMANEIKGDKAQAVEILTKELGVPVIFLDGRKRREVDLLFAVARQNSTTNLKPQITNVDEKQIEQKFEYVRGLVAKLPIKAKNTNKLDRLFLHPVFAIPLFFCVMALVFFVTFGPIGEFLSGIVELTIVDGLFQGLANFAFKFDATIWLGKLLEAVLVTGVGSVIAFTPQFVLLFLMLSFLEDLGYLSRAAFVFDSTLKRVGLSGRSVFSFLVGLGCSTSAVLVTRNLESKDLRVRTALALPFFGCSAKMPIILIIASLFFPHHKFLILFLLYVLSFAIAVLFLAAAKLLKRKKEESFVMEMPRLRAPSGGRIAKTTLSNLKSFEKRVLTTVTIACFILFVLNSFTLSFASVEKTGGKSILEAISSVIAVIFKPLGFGLSGVAIGLIFGLIAKEMIVSSFAMINAVGITGLASSLLLSSSPIHFTVASSLSFLVFVMLFTPCLPMLTMTFKELGFKWAAFSALFQFAVAYAFSFLTFSLANGNLIVLWSVIIILAVFVSWMLIKKRAYRGCSSCKEKMCRQ